MTQLHTLRGFSIKSMILILPVVLLACQAADTPTFSSPSTNQTFVDFDAIFSVPDPRPGHPYDPEVTSRGKYLVTLLGCGGCHSEGALVRNPHPLMKLAGSTTGIAYTNLGVDPNPGVHFPRNLTPDTDTGIGNLSIEYIARSLRSKGQYARQGIVMPWAAYTALTNEDALAIATYLKSIPPVNHRVPASVQPGQPTLYPFVYGVSGSSR